MPRVATVVVFRLSIRTPRFATVRVSRPHAATEDAAAIGKQAADDATIIGKKESAKLRAYAPDCPGADIAYLHGG